VDEQGGSHRPESTGRIERGAIVASLVGQGLNRRIWGSEFVRVGIKLAKDGSSQHVRQRNDWLNLLRIAHDHCSLTSKQGTYDCLRRRLPCLIHQQPAKGLLGKTSQHSLDGSKRC